LWLDTARELGRLRFGGERDSRWPAAPYYDVPTEQDYLNALETDLAADAEKMHYLRMRAWWAGNDRSREGSRFQPAAGFSSRALKNLNCLYDGMSESVEGQRLMKAELARELGLFEEAKHLLAFPFSTAYRHVVKVISNLVEKRGTRVSIVRGDEARTPEEIKALEDARVKRESEQAALEAYLRAAQEAHARQVTEGKACPKCAFSYAWDGKKCGHCHYEKR
jgi:hypothetical protein